MNVRLLVIIRTPLVTELPLSTANALEPCTLCLVSKESSEVNSIFGPLIFHASAFEFSVAQTQVTVSPGHADCLLQVSEVGSV